MNTIGLRRKIAARSLDARTVRCLRDDSHRQWARVSGAIRSKRPWNRCAADLIDYLTLDYLSEVTMSILQKQRARDPKTGYARDFVDMIARVLPDLKERRIRVIANAGGVNPKACCDAVLEVAKRQGIEVRWPPWSRATTSWGAWTISLARGMELKNMETGEPLSAIRAQVQSANVYFGARPGGAGAGRRARRS